MRLNLLFPDPVEGRVQHAAALCLQPIEEVSPCSMQNNRGKAALFLQLFVWGYFEVLCFTSLLHTANVQAHRFCRLRPQIETLPMKEPWVHRLCFKKKKSCLLYKRKSQLRFLVYQSFIGGKIPLNEGSLRQKVEFLIFFCLISWWKQSGRLCEV